VSLCYERCYDELIPLSVMEVPINKTPDAVVSVFEIVTGLFSAYGWTILFVAVILNLLWSHLAPKYREWKRKKLERKELEEYKKNPDLLLAREEALQKSRQKLQEKHDALAREYEEKKKLEEEKKRQEKIENYERLMQGKSKLKPADNSSLRGEYNPLTGIGGGSSGYRPTRRQPGSGGG